MSKGGYIARASYVLLVGLTAALLPCGARAAQERSFDFDIRAQPATSALQAIGRQANAQVIFSPEQLRGVQARSLSGRFTLREAVSRLLAGTNATFTVSQDGAVIVSRGEAHAQAFPDAAAAKAAETVNAVSATAPRAADAGNAAKTPPTPAGLEEIIVTARRREESLQRVPVAITALTGADIESKQIATARDLQQFVPSMAAYSYNNVRDGTSYSLRGQLTTPGTAPGVVVYLNEVPMASDLASQSSGGGPGLYLDLDRLEVLNGPQGTLFGRNTTGGAVLLQSRLPTNQFEGYGQVGAGSYSDREYEGVFNVPIVNDMVLLRVAGQRQTRDGFTRNVVDGQYLDNRCDWATRVTLSFLPSDTVRNDLIYYATASKTSGTSQLLTLVNPAPVITLAPGVSVPIAFFFPTIGQALAEQQALGTRSAANNPPTDQSSRYWSVTDIAKASITDDLVLKNIAAYQSIQSINHGDVDGTALAIGANFLLGHTSTISEELQLQGQSLSNHLNWTAGGFVDYGKPQGPQVEDIALFNGLFVSDLNSGTRRRSRALYAQGTYSLSALAAALDGLNFTAGYRYTWDYRSDFTHGISGSGGCSTGVAPSCTIAGTEQSSAPTWTVGLDYQLDAKTLVYLKSSRGYKAGGFNPGALDPGHVVFAPEFVRDVEVGLKRDWRVDRLQMRTNIAAFHTDYTDIQKSVIVLFGNIPATVTENVAAARIDGVEFAGTVIPLSDFELSATYSYLDARYTKGTQGFDARLPFYMTPQQKYSLSGQYRLPISGDLGRLSLSATYSYTSKLFQSNDFEPGAYLAGYGLLNLRADWAGLAGRPLDLSFFMTNAANTRYRIFNDPLYNALGFSVGTFGEPRMFGFQLRYHWGADTRSP